MLQRHAVSLACFIILAGYGGGGSAPAQPPRAETKNMANQYVINVESRAVGARVGINGVPLAVDMRGEGQQLTRGINEWILPEEKDRGKQKKEFRNHLSVFLFWPAGKEFVKGTASVKASVYIADPDPTSSRPGRIIAEFNWPSNNLPEAYPYTMQIPLAIPEAPPTRLWSEAARINELSDADKGEILQLVERFRSVLVPMQNPADAYALTRYKFEDQARATGADPVKSERIARAQYGIFRQLTKPITKPLAPSRAIFEIVAGGQVVLVTDGPENEAIVVHEEADPDTKYAVDVFVSKIDGHWQIVR